MSEPVIIPAILATTEEEYKDCLDQIEQSGLFDNGWLHIDITSDTVGLDVIRKYPTNLKTEVHLMVDDAELAERFDWADRLIIHFETNRISPNMAVNPETRLASLPLTDLELLLIMGVHPGSQGQSFIPETIQKIKEAFDLRSKSNLNFLIAVDGGISSENIKNVLEAGAERIVIGSHLTKGDLNENFEKIWEAVRQF